MTIHEPLLFASRYGCWSCCLCGWTSGGRWHRTVGAHLAFGRHLLDVELSTQKCLVHMTPDVAHCNGCAADRKAAESA